MKAMNLLTASSCLMIFASFTGCAGRDRVQQAASAATPVYETAEQIKAMPPCKAKVVERAPCYVSLKATDGRMFCVGSPGSKGDITRFLGELKEGHSYDFPEVFVRYQANQPDTSP